MQKSYKTKNSIGIRLFALIHILLAFLPLCHLHAVCVCIHFSSEPSESNLYL